ncbi:MAG: acyltransferase family protein [Lysobacteraceae bacterium]
MRLGAFYLRRARRLYPALFLLVALSLAFAPLWAPAPGPRDAGIALLYLSDYTAAFGHMAEVLKHTWSLSVEEHFYLLWPLAVIGLCRLPRRTALLALVLAYVAATGWRLHEMAAFGDWNAYYRFDTRLPGLLLGSLLALAPRPGGRLPYALLAIPFAVAALASQQPRAFTSFPAEWLGVCLVLWAMQGAKLLTLRPLPYIGRISYGVYLFHWPIALLVRYEQPWPTALAWTLAGSLLLAHVSHRTVERAFRQRPAAAPVAA